MIVKDVVASRGPSNVTRDLGNPFRSDWVDLLGDSEEMTQHFMTCPRSFLLVTRN